MSCGGIIAKSFDLFILFYFICNLNDLIVAIQEKQRELIRFYNMLPHGKLNDEREIANSWYTCLML